MAVWTVRLRPSGSRAPYRWAMTTVAPEESPTKRFTRKLMSTAVAPPTAARASLPTKLPTMMASTVL